MERDKLVKQVKDLYFNYKQATVLDDEFTTEIYDFLVEDGRINFTKQEKIEIYESGKRIYATELNAILVSGTIEEINRAKVNLRLLKINEMKPKEVEYIGNICKRISIKTWFDKLDKMDI